MTSRLLLGIPLLLLAGAACQSASAQRTSATGVENATVEQPTASAAFAPAAAAASTATAIESRHRTLKALLALTEHAALLPNGRQVVSRRVAPCCLQGQAARRRMAAIGKQPGGPGLRTRGAASSLRCVSTYAPSFFLAPHARRRRRGMLRKC